MKILLINTLYYPNVLGGAERSVQFHAETLAGNGEEVVVVSMGRKQGVHIDFLNGVKIYYLGLKNLYSTFARRKRFNMLVPLWHLIDTYNPWMAREVKNIFNLEKPDVVHTNNLSGFSVAVWRVASKEKIPLVHTLRDYYLLCPRSTMFNRGRNCLVQCGYCKAYSLIKKKLSDTLYAVVGNSQFVLDRHLDLAYFRNAKIQKVIFSAYPGNAFRQPDYDYQRRPVRIGFLGRLKPHKGIDFLLQAFAKLPHEEYELKIGGIDELSIRKRWRQQNIHLLGFVEPQSFFSKIDILIVPSLWHDPLPRTIFEAYANGVPVIGANRGGIPEIIDVGKTGFVFNPDNPESLLILLDKLKNNPKLIKIMYDEIKNKSKKFLPGTSAKKYKNIYLAMTGSS